MAAGELPVTSFPSRKILPAGRRQQAHDGLQEAGLPRPVGPHQGHGLALPHRQINPEQRLRRPVVDGEVRDIQQNLFILRGHSRFALYNNSRKGGSG